jgi:hypothetical protein
MRDWVNAAPITSLWLNWLFHWIIAARNTERKNHGC